MRPSFKASATAGRVVEVSSAKRFASTLNSFFYRIWSAILFRGNHWMQDFNIRNAKKDAEKTDADTGHTRFQRNGPFLSIRILHHASCMPIWMGSAIEYNSTRFGSIKRSRSAMRSANAPALTLTQWEKTN